MQFAARRLATLLVICISFLYAAAVSAESDFVVTGTAIPPVLLEQNYGKVPKEVVGYDLNVCNAGPTKQSVVSSEIYQALAQSNGGLQPIGKNIMLAAILRNQNHSKGVVLTLALSSITGVLSILSSAKFNPPSGVITGAALAALSAQQVMTSLKPVLTNDQVEKFEREVLEPALVLDAGSCVERTVFAAAAPAAPKVHSLVFHVR